MNRITVTLEGLRVVWVLNGARLASFPWQAALELAHATRTHAEAAACFDVDAPGTPIAEASVTTGGVTVSVRSEADMVLVIGNGRLMFDMPAAAAADLWKATAGKAREAEELAGADKVAYDAAILHRSGAPFGLANNPAIRREAGSLAQYDRDLRRFMSDGIKSAEVVGAPAVFHETRRTDVRLRALMRRMAPADRSKLLSSLSGAGTGAMS